MWQPCELLYTCYLLTVTQVTGLLFEVTAVLLILIIQYALQLGLCNVRLSVRLSVCPVDSGCMSVQTCAGAGAQQQFCRRTLKAEMKVKVKGSSYSIAGFPS